MARAALSLHRPDEWPEVLTVSQVAALLNTGTHSVRNRIQSGEIDGVRVGGQYRVPAESVWSLVPPSIRAQWPEGRWRDEV